MFYTGSNKPVEFKDIPKAMLAFYEKSRMYDSSCEIIVGTDSQNRRDTKMVSVICMICKGHGGIFFYSVKHMRKLTSVKQKLQQETSESLMLASELIDLLESDSSCEDMYLSCPLCIHVDAGNSTKGKTRPLIPELVGWIQACGYGVCTKPDSFVASTIADKISK